jgi:phosphoglycerate dehydrogenase-like enzyme
MSKLKGLYVLAADAFGLIYPPAIREAIGRHVEMVAEPRTRQSLQENPALLEEVQVIFSGWGAPIFDETLLDAAPRLEAIFYGAGSAGYCITPAVWDRGIVVTTALYANAVPVAEYTMAMILLSLKRMWQLVRRTHDEKRYPDRNVAAGCYGSSVGLISLGAIARTLVKKMAVCDLRVKVYDPFLTEAEAAILGVHRAALDEIFRSCDVVSLHAPYFEETQGMIGREHFGLMKEGATFINTARAEVVRQEEMIEVARKRADLQFILDVFEPEPPPVDSAVYALPNIVLTPHIAGSVGKECSRMGQFMVEELERYVRGEPFVWEVTPELAANSTHRLVKHPPRKAPSVAVAISKLRRAPARAMDGTMKVPVD